MRPALLGILSVVIALLLPFAAAIVRGDSDLRSRLRAIDTRALPSGDDVDYSRMLADDARARITAANQRETRAWRLVESRAAWEAYRDSRLDALRRSLGAFPPERTPLGTQTTGRFNGDGFAVENLVFASRLGLLVTANLYVPNPPLKQMPGILICHSHHNPKSQGELQDMGMTWARQGCLVLVMDQLGHGERRQHPFAEASRFAGAFRAGRQDYYFRHNVGIQLHLIGESLMGWMAWDLMRGVDVLLAQPGVDDQRIILIGSVAGGGDPAAVTAALDPRIAAVVPFNFGGPQPETEYPLAPNAEETFNYAGGGSWESTRNLRLSARDGFHPWVIVGATAPRRLVYAHEFSWDRDHDPVWARLQRVFEFYRVRDHLGAAHGHGLLRGRPPEATHCNNVGAVHRAQFYPLFERWFAMKPPIEEYQQRRSDESLLCLNRTVERDLELQPVHHIASEIGSLQARAARQALRSRSDEARRDVVRLRWSSLLGRIEPREDPRLVSRAVKALGGPVVERIVLNSERNILVPLLLFVPAESDPAKPPLVVGLCQAGKETFLHERFDGIAMLLEAGVVVCLPDVRGTGETLADSDRGRRSAATAIASSEWMLGQTLVGSRLFDLRSVLRYLRTRSDLEADRVVLWGDSFAPNNPTNRLLDVPLDASPFPDHAEPLGGLLSLFGALYETRVRAVYIHRGLLSYQSILENPFLYVPGDAIVPGALQAGDISDVMAAIAPHPLRSEGPVDGMNRPVENRVIQQVYAPVRTTYASSGHPRRFEWKAAGSTSREIAQWMLTHLR